MGIVAWNPGDKMETRLRCTLFPGQFSSELAVFLKSANGREFSLFAQKSDIDYQDTPTENDPVQGWLRVEIVECEKSLCIVRLPQTTLENGQYVTVSKSQLSGVDDGVASK